MYRAAVLMGAFRFVGHSDCSPPPPPAEQKAWPLSEQAERSRRQHWRWRH